MGTESEDVTDYDGLKLSKSDYEELYKRAEDELDGYIDIEMYNVKGVINVYLQEQGYKYDENECSWYK